MITVLEQIHYWLLISPEMGGLNYPFENFLLLTKELEIFKKVEALNSRINPSKIVESKLIIKKIGHNNYKAKIRSLRAIESIFSKQGISAIQNIVEQTRLDTSSFDINWDKLENYLESGFQKEIINQYPIFKVIFNIMFTQISRVNRNIEEIEVATEELTKPDLGDSYTDFEITQLYSLLKKSKRNLQIVDINLVVIPQSEDDGVNQNPLSKSSIKLYKNIFVLESQVLDYLEMEQTAENLFKD
jgi:hypothetical protein